MHIASPSDITCLVVICYMEQGEISAPSNLARLLSPTGNPITWYHSGITCDRNTAAQRARPQDHSELVTNITVLKADGNGTQISGFILGASLLVEVERRLRYRNCCSEF